MLAQDKLNLRFWQQSIDISSNFWSHLVHGTPAVPGRALHPQCSWGWSRLCCKESWTLQDPESTHKREQRGCCLPNQGKYIRPQLSFLLSLDKSVQSNLCTLNLWELGSRSVAHSYITQILPEHWMKAPWMSFHLYFSSMLQASNINPFPGLNSTIIAQTLGASTVYENPVAIPLEHIQADQAPRDNDCPWAGGTAHPQP